MITRPPQWPWRRGNHSGLRADIHCVAFAKAACAPHRGEALVVGPKAAISPAAAAAAAILGAPRIGDLGAGRLDHREQGQHGQRQKDDPHRTSPVVDFRQRDRPLGTRLGLLYAESNVLSQGSPSRIRTRGRRARMRQAIARALVTDFGPRTASSELDAPLRLAAQDDHEIRAFASLGAQHLVRDDQRRSRRRHAGETIQYVLRNDNPVERGARAALVRRWRLDVAPTTPAGPAMRLDRAALWTGDVQ